MASQIGLEAVSIGALANATQMSKSGLYAHFKSKENIQSAILRHAAQLFSLNVVTPTLKVEPGIPQIRDLVNNWILWTSYLGGGCIFIQAGNDFKGRPGKVRDYLVLQQRTWISFLRKIARSAIRVGQFRKGMDCHQFAFELYSLLLGIHLYDKLLDNKDVGKLRRTALDTLVRRYQA